jgi:hypothetical protein
MLCLLCNGSRWRQWYLCLPCIRTFLSFASVGKVMPMTTPRTSDRQIIANARAYATAMARK